MESKTILFHSNKEKICQEFVDGKIPLITSQNNNDDEWLGTGMYFWDNKGNANWWNKKQRNKNQAETYKIINVNVNTMCLLDLTDFEIYQEMQRIWLSLCHMIHANPEKPLGNKLDMLFSAFSDWTNKYPLIKVYGKYNYTPNNGFFTFDYTSMHSEPTIAVKCIYNVKNKDCILEKDFLKEEQIRE